LNPPETNIESRLCARESRCSWRTEITRKDAGA